MNGLPSCLTGNVSAFPLNIEDRKYDGALTAPLRGIKIRHHVIENDAGSPTEVEPPIEIQREGIASHAGARGGEIESVFVKLPVPCAKRRGVQPVTGAAGIIEGAISNDHSRIVVEIHGLELHLVERAILDVGVGGSSPVSRPHRVIIRPTVADTIGIAFLDFKGDRFFVLVVIVESPVPDHSAIDPKTNEIEVPAVRVKVAVVEQGRRID